MHLVNFWLHKSPEWPAFQRRASQLPPEDLSPDEGFSRGSGARGVGGLVLNPTLGRPGLACEGEPSSLSKKASERRRTPARVSQRPQLPVPTPGAAQASCPGGRGLTGPLCPPPSSPSAGSAGQRRLKGLLCCLLSAGAPQRPGRPGWGWGLRRKGTKRPPSRAAHAGAAPGPETSAQKALTGGRGTLHMARSTGSHRGPFGRSKRLVPPSLRPARSGSPKGRRPPPLCLPAGQGAPLGLNPPQVQRLISGWRRAGDLPAEAAKGIPRPLRILLRQLWLPFSSRPPRPRFPPGAGTEAALFPFPDGWRVAPGPSSLCTCSEARWPCREPGARSARRVPGARLP